MRFESRRDSGASKGSRRAKKHILQSHDAQTYRPPPAIRITGGRDGIEIDVDDAVEESDRGSNGISQLLKIELAFRKVFAQIDRTKIADSRFLTRADFGDLRAQI